MGRRRAWRMDESLESGEGGNRPRGDHEPARGGRLPIGARPGAAILFIVNPSSGGGKAGREWAGVESWLPSSGLPYEVAFTTRPFEATEMAQKAVLESRPVIVAVGGDGTLNEVVNGFFRNGAPIPTTSKLAMVPLGTGGDFRRTLRIPIDPKQAIEVLRSGMVRRLDAGCVTYQTSDGATAVRHFINIADAGLGGDVVYKVNRGSKRLGALTYKVGSGLALLTYKNKPMTMVIDGSTHELAKAQQVVVANCQFFGGGGSGPAGRRKRDRRGGRRRRGPVRRIPAHDVGCRRPDGDRVAGRRDLSRGTHRGRPFGRARERRSRPRPRTRNDARPRTADRDGPRHGRGVGEAARALWQLRIRGRARSRRRIGPGRLHHHASAVARPAVRRRLARPRAGNFRAVSAHGSRHGASQSRPRVGPA